MIVGLGTDIISIKRIDKSLNRYGDKFAKKILTPDEFDLWLEKRDKARILAKRFAAKEACVKALGTGFRQGISWQDITLEHTALGAPKIGLIAKALERYNYLEAKNIHLSLTDEHDYAFATVIIEK